MLDLIEAEIPESQGMLTCGGESLPLPGELDGRAFRADFPDVEFTSLSSGVAETARAFKSLHRESRLSLHDLEEGA